MIRHIVFCGEYTNNKIKYKFLHKKCGHEFYMRVNDFLSGHRCPYCKHVKKFTTEEYRKRILELTNNKFELASEYVNDETKIKIKHLACGSIISVYPYDLRNRGFICKKCNKEKRRLKSEDIFKNKVFSLTSGEYEVLGKYVNPSTKIKLLHKTCGNIFEMSPRNFLSNERCPICKPSSKGEEKIKSILNAKNIKYEQEYKFKDCKDQNQLRFDFAVFKNSELLCLIEYDGWQHSHFRKSSKFFNNKETLEEIQRHDKIKNDYCKEHKIELLRISYKDYKNIEKILTNKFIDYSIGEAEMLTQKK